MRKNLTLLLTLVFIALFIGCSKTDETVSEAKTSLEKYIEAINEKDEKTLSTLIDSNTVSQLGSTDTVYIKLKNIKHDSKFNSEDAPKERFVAFEIEYDVKYDNGNESTQKRWIALEKVNDTWVVRSVAKA